MLEETLCFEEDDYTYEKPRWVAKLEDGRTIIGDDDRPGLEIPSSWRRLKNYVYLNNLDVVSLYLQFRSNRIHFPDNELGYFFYRGIFGDWGGFKFSYYIVGTINQLNLDSGLFGVRSYRVPSYEVFEEEVRSIASCEDGLIWQKNLRKNPPILAITNIHM